MMMLDIGSNEGIHPEADIGIDIILNKDSWQAWEGRVDVCAEASKLPFRDNIFNKVYSGACIGTYVPPSALYEVFRTCKQGGVIELRVLLPGVPDTLGVLLGNARIYVIEHANCESTGEIHDVVIHATNTKSQNWTLPGETFDTPGSWVESNRRYLADRALEEREI